MQDLLSTFWGKARSTSANDVTFHSVVHHSLDVAATGAEIIACNPLPLKRIAASAGIELAALQGALPFLLALHDIGKYARAFQAKSPDHWPEAALGPYRGALAGDHHVDTGYRLLRALSERGPVVDVFEAVFPGWRTPHRQIIFRALAGHHGRPPKDDSARLSTEDVCDACIASAAAHVETTSALLRPASLQRLRETELTILAVGLSGLFVLADWIGSSEQWFPYTPSLQDDERCERYWALACLRARRAVQDARVGPSSVVPFAGLAPLFPKTRIETLSPIQAFAETAPLPDGPSLVIVEDVTGSGKTEAAVTLAHRLMASGRANGLYVALPTEATANAMYLRLGDSFRNLFAEEATPSLVLAHGRRSLHPGFQGSIVTSAADEGARNGSLDARADERPSSAECAAWIADDRRKAFLADVGAGTIDQALLAVLPVKHQSLRLWGLADRVLIIDEAHAYDAYMTRELETLLEFQAALGGSAIVLSATLPHDVRSRLARAFSDGISGRGSTPASLQANEYPLVTIVGPDTVSENPLRIRDGLGRFVAATRVDDIDAALARVMAAASAGACVALVRNSVDEAITAWERLRASGLDAMLFHARFAMWDRQRVEKQVMACFGASSTPEQRRGRVLVATQVIEQSLDLDFDLLITDLAPVDLLIQRAGRLWRHARGPRPIDGPELVVISGEPIDDPDRDWAARAIGRGSRVYADHAMLWRSARALFGAGGISTPDGVRSLVEAVYDEATREPAPGALSASEIRQEGEDRGATAVADMNVLSLRRKGSHQFPGYQYGHGSWDADVRTPTRLSGDSVRIRLGRFGDGKVSPWADVVPAARAWALSEVSVRRNRIAGQDDRDPELASAMAAVKAAWPDYERDIPLIVLRRVDDGSWSGSALGRGDDSISVTYRADAGLQIV